MNSVKKWYGFYTQPNFWAIENPNITNNFLSLSDVLSQIVFEESVPFGKIRVCRDGLILCFFNGQLSAQDILCYLNCLYILLQSRLKQHFFSDFINSFELTLQDVVYHEYEDLQIAKFDISSVNQLVKHQYLARRVESYVQVNVQSLDTSPGSFWNSYILHRILHDARISDRAARVIPRTVFDLAVQDVATAGKDYVFVQVLAALHKSRELYTLGNYDMSLIQSWFVIEAYLFKLLKRKSPHLDTDQMSSSEAIKQLKILKVISYQVGNDLHAVRIARNKVVHSTFDSTAKNTDALIAIEAIRGFLERDTGITLLF